MNKERKHKKKESESRKYNLKFLYQDIAEMEAKVKNLAKVYKHFEKYSEDFVYEADENVKKVWLLVSKATTLRRKSSKKKAVVKGN